jgi:serine/threonine-protein kinase
MPDGDDSSRAGPPAETTTTAVDPVRVRLAAGDYAGAAAISAQRGDLGQALALYERIWRFADAVPLALALGDRPRAVRLALDAGDPARAAAIAEAIPRDAAGELREAAAAFAGRGRHWEAGRVAERAGMMEQAAAYYRRAGSLLDAGRMEEAGGRLHEAGMIYEQALDLAADADEAAAAQLALGRLLGRLGRHEDAVRALQRAMRAPQSRPAAARALTAELLALGFRVAAGEIAARLRREAPELPATAEEIAALETADVAARTSALGQVAAEPGLVRRRFKVLRSLGAGASSQVYLAEDTLLGRPVALKLLTVGAGGRGLERQAYLRFAREAEAAGRLRHPNIVNLHDADPGMGLFVLELMAGGTLEDRLAAEGPLSPAAARRLALDLLSALAAAHDRRIVHRDVKPANVFFDAAGNAKLGDFGAAHLVDFGQTQTGGLLGTVAYMSPEQITGAAIGPGADLYALGVTLFEALTGRLPFPGPDVVSQHLGEEPPRPSLLRPELDDLHDEVLLRALRKAPSERWDSAEAMAAAVIEWGAAPALAAGIALRATSTGAAEAARAATADAPTSGDVVGADTDTDTDVVLGRTTAGLLVRHEDPRLGRTVLVERRDTAAVGDALSALQRLAAAGGAHVQRVLALSDDGLAVTYELLDGPVLPVETLSPAVLANARAALAAAGVPEITLPRAAVLTPAGPVLLVVTAQD